MAALVAASAALAALNAVSCWVRVRVRAAAEARRAAVFIAASRAVFAAATFAASTAAATAALVYDNSAMLWCCRWVR